MKLEVPFNIPVILFIFIPLKLFFSVEIIGIPPATDASKPILTPFSSANLAKLYPWWAIKALFAVTRFFLFFIAWKQIS